LLHYNPERFTFLVPAYPYCPGKKALKRITHQIVQYRQLMSEVITKFGKAVAAPCGKIYAEPMHILLAGNDRHCVNFTVAWQRCAVYEYNCSSTSVKLNMLRRAQLLTTV